MVRIVYVSSFAGMVGGGEHSLLALMQNLPEPYQPFLITPEEGAFSKKASLSCIDTGFLPMPPLGFRSFAALRCWVEWLNKERPSLIHANNSRAAFYAGLAGKRLGIPVIFHCRVAAKDRKLDWILVRLVSKVVCNSYATAERFQSWRWLKPFVIHNGLDVEVMSLLSDQDESQKINLLFVGRFSEEKQPDIAWKIFSELAEKIPKLDLVFVGNDDPFNPSLALNLKKKVARSPLKERVVWAGFQQDMSPWYAMANLVIMPSKYEGFGRVLVEAMAHRVPVVAFRVGGIPEVIEDGIQGVLIEPYDIDAMREAVHNLLRDDVERRQMGEAGPDRAKRFSLSSHIEEVIRLYHSLIRDSHGD